MGRFRVVAFHEVCRSLLGLSKVSMINILLFVVFNILHNLVFVQKNLCLQITADISKISESVQGDVASILNVLSETDVFVQICLVLEIKNLVNLIKTSFY